MGRPRIPVADRLIHHSERTVDGCLVWTGCKTRDGYGKITIPRVWGDWSQMRTAHVHRIAWELANGAVPDGLHLDHICRNRACFDVAHLRLATPRENIFAAGSEASARANAAKTHCKHGHELSGDNLIVYLSRGTLARACRECRRASGRRYQRRRRANL